MISKLRFSLVAVIMLVLLGFGFQNQAQAQVGDDGLFCPAVPNTTGWLEVDAEVPAFGPTGPLPIPDFSGALIGSVESLIGGPLHGGMDWQHVDFTSFFTPTPTNETGSQLVSWWTQKDGRNTSIQVTNAFGNVGELQEFGTWVHVHIFDENCVEIRDFCDFYTEFDTHVYNFGDIVSNLGVDVPDGNIQGKEGFVTVTAVDNCPTPGLAIEHDHLAGNTFVKSVSTSDYMYGFATYHRQGVCFDIEEEVTVNRVLNGSFQNGAALFEWVLGQGNSSGITELNIAAGDVDIPPASFPDSLNPNSNLFMGFAISTNDAGFQSPPYGGGPFIELATDRLIDAPGVPFETNVTVVTSNIFTLDANNTLLYDLSFLLPSIGTLPPIPSDCANFVMVCVIDDTTGVANFEACDCRSANGQGFEPANFNNCTSTGTDFDQYTVNGAGGSFNFFGGRSAFFTNQSLPIAGPGTFAVQYITGQAGVPGCSDTQTDENPNTGAFVDNFRVLVTEIEVLECDGILDGSINAFLDFITPDVFAGQFDAQDGSAGADVVHINFLDEYLPSYTPQAAFINAVVGIWNDIEVFDSCGEAPVCFIRLGVDEALILSDNFVGPPTTPPTLGPTTQPPTQPPTQTPTSGPSGGSGSCAIAGNPVQLGTAFANVLIPLVPVAFVFGIRAMRRRKK